MTWHSASVAPSSKPAWRRHPALLHAAQAVTAAEIPILVISGGWSPAFDAICRVVARLTNGRYETVRSPNHFPQMQNAEAFNALVDAFAREAETRRS